MSRRHLVSAVVMVAACLACPLCQATAQDRAEDHEAKQRLRKLQDLEEEKEDISPKPLGLDSFLEKATLSGFIELNYAYTDVSDTEDKNSKSRSDLFISSVDLELRVFFNEWVKTKIVVNAEDIGIDEQDEKIVLDEAIVTLESPWFPVSLIAGKTVLPFGVFEDHMISGTLTEDLYEIDDVGATLSYAQDVYGLDVSLTVYKGENIIENLEDFGTHEFRSGRENDQDVNSFIANLTLEPVEEILELSAYYDNEPGDGRRNQSAGGSLTLNIWKFSLDAEYITALARENGEDAEQNKESAWFAALLFKPIDKLELAARYEAFDDDRSGQQDEVVDYRWLAGFNYLFSDFAVFSFEYRYSGFEKESGSDAADAQNEFQLQLSLGF